MDRGQASEGEITKPGRDLRLDLLRGVAVLLMTEQHLGIWLVNYRKYWGSLGPLVLLNMLGGMAAPLFVLLAGVGASYALEKGGARGAFVRGARLIALGYLLNLLTPGWFGLFSFYVLHLLGVWLMLAPGVIKLGRAGALALAFGALGAAALGQIMLQTPRELTNMAMSGRTGTGPLRLAFFEGHFPLFPWLAVALLGFAAGGAFRAGRRAWLFGFSASCAGLALVAYSPTWIVGRASRQLPWRALAGLEFYPATPALLLGLGAIGIALLALFARPGERSWLREDHPLVLFGRTSLTLLVAHVVIFREIFGRIGLSNRFSPPETLAILASTWTLWWLLARAWSKSGYLFGLEWLLRVRLRRR